MRNEEFSLRIAHCALRIMKDGFINLNKPSGMTSHDAVNHVRRIFSTRKVGHAGTLDPAASGVLPIAINRATKFIEYLADLDKSYRAEILFGIATDSGDLEGEVIARADDFTMPTADKLKDALKTFIGEIEQTPPKFSAIKIHGRKAYDLARRDIDFEMPRRLVKISRLELVNLDKDSATIEIDCGKGTYIRSLAIDLGERLNLPATLKSLVRLRVGDFSLSNALTLDDIKKFGADCLLPIEDCLKHLPKFELAEHRVRAFMNGLPTTISNAQCEMRNEDSGVRIQESGTSPQSLVPNPYQCVMRNDEALRIFSGGKFLGIGRIERGELKSSKLA